MKKTIREIYKRIRAVDLDKEIILVDNFSTDGTREIIKEFENDNTNIYFYEKNLVKGAALRTGFQKATGDILVIQDADL
jgi:glycosyltransferase involved in cell wall biosynthesis